MDAFRKECGYSLVNLVEKILEWSPLWSVIVCSASVLDPKDILMISTEEAEKKMKLILNHLINLKQVAPVFSDKSIHWFFDRIKSMSRHVYSIQQGISQAWWFLLQEV